MAQFRVAQLPEDAEALERARHAARAICDEDPRLEAPEHALLAHALQAAFGPEALQPLPA